MFLHFKHIFGKEINPKLWDDLHVRISKFNSKHIKIKTGSKNSERFENDLDGLSF